MKFKYKEGDEVRVIDHPNGIFVPDIRGKIGTIEMQIHPSSGTEPAYAVMFEDGDKDAGYEFELEPMNVKNNMSLPPTSRGSLLKSVNQLLNTLRGGK